jgi:hypothetical protein
MKYGDVNFPELPGKCDEKTIAFLSKIKKITQKEIPVPFDLSNKQKEIVNSNISTRFSQKDAFELLKDLKKYNVDIACFFVIVLDARGKELSREYMGFSQNLNLVKIEAKKTINSTMEQWNIKDMEGNDFDLKTSGNPDDFVKSLEASLNNVSKKEDLEYDNTFGIKISVTLEKEFWENVYVVDITLKKSSK